MKRWTAFARFLGDGRVCRFYAAAELGGIAIGRGGWTLAGLDAGCQGAAVVHTPIETCELTRIRRITHKSVGPEARFRYQWLWANGTGWNASSVRMMRASAAPTSGAYSVGDTVYNTAPASGGFIGWVCTAAGSPGTWKGFGTIS